jgi:glycosyltransferase involved in cell wall biosynthesis
MTAARFRPGVKYESLAYLLKSLARLKFDHPEMILLIVGDGTMEEQIKALAKTFLDGRTIFTGRVARKDMVQYYSASDLFVFPGIGESLGMVYLEAQACGLPVVALQSPGVSQVVMNGQTGLLVTEDDGEDMAKAVGAFLNSHEMRRGFGEEALKYVTQQRNAQRTYRQLSRGLEETAQNLVMARNRRR